MNNLTTRKIVLGLLMVLVLAFSVQDIVDAQSVSLSGDGTTTSTSSGIRVITTDGTSSPDDVERFFTIRVTGAKNGENVTISTADSTAAIRIIEVEVTSAPTAQTSFLNTDGDSQDTVQSGDAQISPARGDTNTTSNAISTSQITFDGLGGPDSDTATGNWTIKVSYEVTGFGAYEIDIGGTVDNSAAGSPIQGYVVRSTSQANNSRTGFTGTLPPSIQVNARSENKQIAVTTTSYTRVKFDIESGDGSLFVNSGTYYVDGSNVKMNGKDFGANPFSVYTANDGSVTVNYRPNTDTTARIKMEVEGSIGSTSKHYVTIFYYPRVTINRISGNQQFGQINSDGTLKRNRRQLGDPLVIRVLDGSRTVANQVVRFTADRNRTALLRYQSIDTYVQTTIPGSGQNENVIYVRTDSRGDAKVYLVPSTVAGTDTVIYVPVNLNADASTATAITAVDIPDVDFTATATPAIRTGDGLRISRDASETTESPQRNAQYGNLNNLVMSVKIIDDDSVSGTAFPDNVQVHFQITGGRIYLSQFERDLENPDYQTSLTTVTETVDGVDGIATVYVEVNNGATAEVTAQIVGNNTPRGRHTVTYFWGDPNYDDDSSGGSRNNNNNNNNNNNITNTITIFPSSIDGEPGEEIEFTVIPSSPSITVLLNSGDLDDGDFSVLFGAGNFTVTLTLPDEEDTYTFTATSPTPGYPPVEVTVTVESEEVALGTLSIVAVGAPSGGQQTIRITVRDSAGNDAVGAVSVTLRGTGIDRIVPTADGSGAAVIAVPNTVAVGADGYARDTLTLTGTGQQEAADDEEEEEETPTAAEPDSIEITGPAARSGTVNEELAAALIVRVLDDDGDGLEDARVFYRVIEGRGRISDGSRGGRRIGVVTDDDGYARVNFTPTDGGTHTIRVNTDDLSATVEFTITTDSASGARDAGTGGTSGASISPVVHVAAASRPPMLWVDGGEIYALVGASPQRFAASVDNALNIAIGGGKVYWTEKTGDAGTINSANLNGSDVTELTSIKAVPMGIAVDVAGSQLYWTNSRGRIQSADLDGSGITNVMQNLQSPMDLALAGGNAYWTQGNGSVRFVNLRGQKVVRNVSTGTDTPGSLVIGGGKVYWTETTGESGGTVNSANLNGTGATQLASILAAPMGIAVDGSRSKLYWTNSRGRVQSANLDGSGIKNVVSGLGSPGELVLSNSIAAPAGAGSSAGSGTTASDSKYDVNGDGVVDRFDALLVVSAFGTSNNKYDVNGDGTVNVKDYDLVFDNLAPGAAAAPAIVGMKFSAAQIDRIEEQIDLLIATNDRSPATLRTLIYLQQLLVTARPEKTQLLANYPNPFNPETWIPYELATDTNVRLTIYNTQGVVIRSLQFGHQSAGYYTGRDRAAYWDGRNSVGEQVASGLYFYQLETDEMSLLRKMVILK